ncbi:MAG: DUF4329 domain-containing protein [Pseudomonadota bacterium]
MPKSVGRSAAIALVVSGALGPAASAEPGYSPLERALVMSFMQSIQRRSFELNAEHCGYIVRDDAGHLRMTGPYLGEEASCLAPWPAWAEPVASWHTHGAFDPDAYNELPSGIDVETDAEEGIDGWIATPGGRLWHVDGANRVSVLVCGRGCLPADPAYDPAATGEIAQRYEFEDLLDRLGE